MIIHHSITQIAPVCVKEGISQKELLDIEETQLIITQKIKKPQHNAEARPLLP